MMTIIFAFDKNWAFALLQSSFHEAWARQYSSTMKQDLRYTPTDIFQTFPFPNTFITLSPYHLVTEVDEIGEHYHEHRRQAMLARQEGLTKTYNRFHDPAETSADIAELRRLHVAMDHAVAVAYGWADLDLGHGFHQAKQGLRYTISEAARRTVLDRLLALNHERYEEEKRQGLHDQGAKKAAGKVRDKKIIAKSPSFDQAPQLVMDFGEPKQVDVSAEPTIVDFRQAAQQRASKKAAETPATYDATPVGSLAGPVEPQPVPEMLPLDRHVILLARIIEKHRQHGFDNTLGHVKAEKIAHIAEAHYELDLGRAPVRAAAGPVDFQHFLAVIERGKALGAFYDRERLGERKAFQFMPLPGLDHMASRMPEAFGPLVSRLDELIDLFVGLDTDEAEIVATLYAAWNDLLAAGKEVNEHRLFQEFFNWDVSKRRFTPGGLRTMKKWMEAVGLIPTGKAKQTLPLRNG